MDGTLQIPKVPVEREGSLWPSDEYDQQIAKLRQCAGEKIYLLEVNFSEIYITLSHVGQALTLLDIIEFPKPDPGKYLYPHMLVTEDGRGINLGRIARVSVKQPFMPEEEDIIYKEMFLLQHLAYCERRMSDRSIHQASKMQLAKILGETSVTRRISNMEDE